MFGIKCKKNDKLIVILEKNEILQKNVKKKLIKKIS